MLANLTPLQQLAREANARLDRAKVAEGRARDLRISAGEVLAQAKDRVRAGEPGHTNWARWVRENIKHSYRDANKCIAIAQSSDPKAALEAERATARVGMASSRARVGQTFDPGTEKPSTVAILPGERAVTIETVKQDILLLSTGDRDALAAWLAPRNEVRRDGYGNVLDPLAVRLKRALYRLKDRREHGLTRESSKYEQYIYNELNKLSGSLKYGSLKDAADNSIIINIQLAVGHLIDDLIWVNGATSAIVNDKYQNGLRELEAIIAELNGPVIGFEAVGQRRPNESVQNSL
jgi:hypothetical protein